MFSTVQRVRQRSGFQNYRIDSPLKPTGDSSIWNNNVKDLEKYIPRLSNGASIASVSDINVRFEGLSVGFVSMDVDSGNISLVAGSTTGASFTATFASSPIRGEEVMEYMVEANSQIIGALSVRYTFPLSSGVCIPVLSELETRLASAHMLIDSYGVSSQDSAEDGYKMLEAAELMLDKYMTGELKLVDDGGNTIPVNTGGIAGGGNASGGHGVRVKGYLFTTDQENFEVVDPNRVPTLNRNTWG